MYFSRAYLSCTDLLLKQLVLFMSQTTLSHCQGRQADSLLSAGIWWLQLTKQPLRSFNSPVGFPGSHIIPLRVHLGSYSWFVLLPSISQAYLFNRLARAVSDCLAVSKTSGILYFLGIPFFITPSAAPTVG